MMKYGKNERCNHKPCVCEGLGGYMRKTEVVRKQVGWRDPEEDIGPWRADFVREKATIFEDVFSYSWLKAVRM